MLEIAKELLSKIEDNGFKAYIVGGFVRDIYIGRESIDIDVCTNATPMDLKKIFDEVRLDSKEYGSVTLIYKGVDFEITTFRKEIKYENNRKPIEIKYISSLDEDLKRRDLTINTLCMDKNVNVIDKFNGFSDIKARLIKIVGNPDYKLKEDSLRILRAIRFGTILNFDFDVATSKAIMDNAELINKLSYQRIKEEFDRIFTSSNIAYGFDLIKKFNIDKILGISNFSEVVIVNDLLGIWAQLDIDLSKWPFIKTERDMIKKIREVFDMDLDIFTLYNYGLYIFQLVSKIKKVDTSSVVKYYNDLPIKNKKEIKIDIEEILKLLNKEKGSWIKYLIDDIEEKIVLGRLDNSYQKIKDYIIKKYK